jgi:hypothetical protein
MNALHTRMVEEIEANQQAEADATPEAVSEAPTAPASAPLPAEPAPVAPAEAVPAGPFERALRDLDELRGIVLGSQLGALEDTIARVDAEVAAETQRVRAAITEIDDRLTSRLDALAIGGQRGRKQLADELAHAIQEIGESLTKRNDKILAAADTEFAALREKLLDSSAFTALIEGMVTKLDH